MLSADGEKKYPFTFVLRISVPGALLNWKFWESSAARPNVTLASISQMRNKDSSANWGCKIQSASIFWRTDPMILQCSPYDPADPAVHYEGLHNKRATCDLTGLFYPKNFSYWGHMKALHLLFHWRYGSQLCSRKWLCGSPKCRLGYSKAGTLRGKRFINFICPIKFLFLNLSSQSRWHMIAQSFLFKKRYHDPKCYMNWLSDKQKCGVTFPIFPLSSEWAGLAVP